MKMPRLEKAPAGETGRTSPLQAAAVSYYKALADCADVSLYRLFVPMSLT